MQSSAGPAADCDLDQLELRSFVAAVVEARVDERPDTGHEELEAVAKRQRAELLRRAGVLLAE